MQTSADMSMMDSRDDICDRLLMLVGRGDRAALGELFAIDAGRLLAIARRFVRRPELAEEIVQEAFVAVWRTASSYDPARGRARAWMTTIVRNRSLNMIRDGSRIDLVGDERLAAYQERAAEAEAAFDTLAEGDALRRCLEGLEPQRRQCILLAYVVGYSHDEIATQLSSPVGTVKAWIRRGTIALQECLS